MTSDVPRTGRVHRSKMIKHNKDLLESIDDRTALLGQLHIY